MIFIKGNIPALKNGKQWTGKFIVSSSRVKDYLTLHGIKAYSSRKQTVEHLKTGPGEFFKQALLIKDQLKKKVAPYKIGFHFVRQTKHKFDFGNAVELIADLFTAYNIWEDDNMDVFHPSVLYIEDKGYTHDKDNPGVYIKVL